MQRISSADVSEDMKGKFSSFKLQISLSSLFSCLLIHRFSLSLCLSTDATRWCLGCCLISTQTFPCKQLHTDIPAEWICEGKCTEAGMIWWQNRAGVRAEWEEKLERMTVKINFGIKEWEERDKRWNGISGKDTKVHVKTDQAWCRLEKQEIRQLTSSGLLSYLHPSQLSLLNRYMSEKEAYGEKQTNRRVQEKISVWRRSITYRDKSARRRKKAAVFAHSMVDGGIETWWEGKIGQSSEVKESHVMSQTNVYIWAVYKLHRSEGKVNY